MATPPKQRLLIFDGNAIIHRCFHALPPLAAPDGTLVNAVYGFLTTLFKTIKDFNPTHVVVTFDLAGPTFRHEEFKEYKATRVKQAQELYDQIPLTKEVLEAMGIPVYEKQGFEADDVIGTISAIARASHPPIETIIVTGDNDALQLVDETTHVFTMRRGITDTVIYDIEGVVQKFGFAPTSVIDYKALRGDVSDNIPGVKGIGEKTGMELITRYGTVENLYSAIDAADTNGVVADGVTPRIQKLLLEKRADAIQSKRLATIVRDVPIDFSFDTAEYTPIDREKVFPVFQKFGFLSLIQRIPQQNTASLSATHTRPDVREDQKKTKSIIAKDVSKTRTLIEKLLKEQEVAVYLLKPQQQDLFGSTPFVMGFAWEDHVATVEISDEAQWDEIGRLFLDKSVTLIAHDVKQLMHDLALHGIRIRGEVFDVMVAAYLLQAGTRAHDLPNLVITILGEDVPVTEWAYGDPTRAGRGAERVRRIAELVSAQMDEKGFGKLSDEIEMPLIGPLARMERYGILLDGKYLKKLDDTLSDRLEKLSKSIHKMAGHEFNIASPQQVSEVLFDELGLSAAGIKRGKTGSYSTAADALDKLRGSHEIVDGILEYREIAKLLNTYVQALPKLVGPDGRIHTSYNQCVAATGRLSSQDPNLQNIPVRTELGKEIRGAFVAEDGYVLLSCDYSQIELRIVAHIAQDKKLIEIFERGLDVHRATAAEINGVALEDVTKEMRYAAKEINFGIIYGMGAWGLADRTGLPREQARAFIDKYLMTFSGVARYIEETKAIAKRLGYVETLFGRRRYIPEISSGVATVRASGERMAVNMPIQGTQADIIKMAMISIDEMLLRDYGIGMLVTPEERDAPARMLLQVHDELIFEVQEKMVDEVRDKILDIMINAAHLSVPLKVDSAVGSRWSDLD